MANMAYCRFQNTLKDLRDCYEHLDDEGLSDDECHARDKLVDLCITIGRDCDEDYWDDN